MATLEIIPPSAPLLTSSPNLMPFHVDYTGPAPISRYFRPKPAPQTIARSLTSTSDSTITIATASSNGTQNSINSLQSFVSNASSATTIVNDDAGSKKYVTVEATQEFTVSSAASGGDAVDMELIETQQSEAVTIRNPDLDTSREPFKSAVERFVAAFRGRRVCGQAVNLPDGYGGLVLRASSLRKGKGRDDGETLASKPQSKAKPASTRAATRRSTRSAKTEEDSTAGADESIVGTSRPSDPSVEVRKLVPSSTFSSFTIWSPDIAVDEGRDEYMRSLVEWTKLAAEVHSYED